MCHCMPGVDWSQGIVPVHHHCQVFIGFACLCVSQQGTRSHLTHNLRFGHLVQALTRAAFELEAYFMEDLQRGFDSDHVRYLLN